MAAWMPPTSPQGRVHGVSRERWGAAHPANQPVAASDKVRPTKPLRLPPGWRSPRQVVAAARRNRSGRMRHADS
ncbi:hypothetical protein D0A40_09505 [Xanthomonas campestris pv. raphani]|nr:hypothetical protein D0A40_09505 [Xanthomonas campestris pv. raphani]